MIHLKARNKSPTFGPQGPRFNKWAARLTMKHALNLRWKLEKNMLQSIYAADSSRLWHMMDLNHKLRSAFSTLFIYSGLETSHLKLGKIQYTTLKSAPQFHQHVDPKEFFIPWNTSVHLPPFTMATLHLALVESCHQVGESIRRLILVGGWTKPFEKSARQNGNLPQF